MSEQEQKRWYIILLIVLFGLFLRIGITAFFKNRSSPGEVVKNPASEVEYLRQAYMELGDSQQYQLLANNLRTQGRFTWNETPVTF
ncbi:MAG: hypothetical protein ABIK39_03600, partial [candidate division WOR-3 bacterium]